MEFGYVMGMVVLFGLLVSQSRVQLQTEKRLRDLQVRFEKLLVHVGFEADAAPVLSEELKVLARTPGAEIAAITAYRQQTGAGLKEAKAAVERMASEG